MKTIPQYIDEFDKLWTEGNYGYNHIGKNTMQDFLQSSLYSQKAELMDKLEVIMWSMKRELSTSMPIEYADNPILFISFEKEKMGYNKALSDLKIKIKELR